MIKVTRKINWVSSIEKNDAIEELSKAMQEFYSSDNFYFSEIDFTANNWVDKQMHCYQRIVDLAHASNSVCEVGCGRANILKHYPSLQNKFTGLDFSESLMRENEIAYPEANFHTFQSPEIFPVDNEQFDLVFCVFVMEHVTKPSAFLDECTRIMKPGGTLVILCPDYLGKKRMMSQRAGFSAGTSKTKLKEGKYFDALVTLFDNRVRIPFVCKNFARKAEESPLFLINCSPLMFADKFFPDADAVYVTFKKEIQKYLQRNFKEIINSSPICEMEDRLKLIFLEMQKKI